MAAEIKIYTTPICPYCVRAKQLLSQKGATYQEIDLSRESPEVRQQLMAQTRHRTVPQIFIGGQFIGGFDDLYALERQGKLDALLAG
jgi:glutaredoxin 3